MFRRVKKPLKPKVTVQVATEMPLPIPLLGAYFSADIESTLMFAYGNFMKPSFEKAVSLKKKKNNNYNKFYVFSKFCCEKLDS